MPIMVAIKLEIFRKNNRIKKGKNRNNHLKRFNSII